MMMRHFVQGILHPVISLRALKVALVVGTILNLINNYELLLGVEVGVKDLVQIFLTYLVPYLVSTHGQLLSGVHANQCRTGDE